MNDSERKPKVTTYRLDPDVHAGAQAVAIAERRSMNSAVNVLIAEALAARAAITGSTPEPIHTR